MTLNCSIPALGILTFPKKVLMLREITTPDAAPPLEDTSFRLAELLACYRGVGNTEENGDMEENVIEEEDADSNMEEEGFMDHVPILNTDDYADSEEECPSQDADLMSPANSNSGAETETGGGGICDEPLDSGAEETPTGGCGICDEPLEDEIVNLTLDELLAGGLPFYFAVAVHGAMRGVRTTMTGTGPLQHINVLGVPNMPPGCRLQRIYTHSGNIQYRGFLQTPTHVKPASHQKTGPDAMEKVLDWLWQNQ